MDTNRSSDMMHGSDVNTLRVPSGFEVESASLHVPTTPTVDVTLPSSSSPSWKEKLSNLPTSLKSSVANVKPMMSSKWEGMRGSVREGSMKMQRSMHMNSMKLQSSMRSQTGMWAGIATGVGVGLGLLGRYARHRNDQHGRMPTLLIVETSC